MTPPPLPDPRGSRVLLVEDDPDIAMLLCLVLQRRGFEVRVETDVEGAYDAVAAESDWRLVVLDRCIPGGDGLEVLERLRAHGGRDVPVLVSSARCSNEDIDRVLAAGATGFVAKPFGLTDIAEVIEGMVHDDPTVPQVLGPLASCRTWSEAVGSH